MKRKKIIQTLALALSLVSLPVGEAMMGGNVLSKLGIIQIAKADTLDVVLNSSGKTGTDTKSYAASNGISSMNLYTALGDTIVYNNGVYIGGSGYNCYIDIEELDQASKTFKQKLYGKYSTTYDSLREIVTGNLKITGGAMNSGWTMSSTYAYFKSRNATLTGSSGATTYTGVDVTARADSNGVIWDMTSNVLRKCVGNVRNTVVTLSGQLKEIDSTDTEICLATGSTIYKLNSAGVTQWSVPSTSTGTIVYSVIEDGYYKVYSQSGSTLYQVKYSLADGTSTSNSVNLSQYGSAVKFSNLTGDADINAKNYTGFIVSANNSATGVGTVIKVDKDLNIVSSASIPDLSIGTVTYNGKAVYGNVTKAQPYMKSGNSFIGLNLADGTYDPINQSYSTVFNYKNNLGVSASSTLNLEYNSNIYTGAPVVVRDDYNYKIFDYWKYASGTQVGVDEKRDSQAGTVLNAVYKESADSFWVDNNRYGIIAGTTDVILLGSNNTTLAVPKTVTDGTGTTYNVTKVQANALTNNTAVADLTVDSSQLSVPLASNSSLTNLAITGTAPIIADAFKGFTGLSSVSISNSVTGVGTTSFQGCASILTGTAPWEFIGTLGLPRNAGFSYTGDVNKDGIAYEYTDVAHKALKVARAQTTDLSGDIAIPDNVDGVPVTDINSAAFQGCNSMTAVNIPNSVTSIGAYAFQSCSNIKVVKVPDSVTSMGDGAFANCANLTTLRLSNSLTSFNGTWIASDTKLLNVGLSTPLLVSAVAPTGYYKVYFLDEDEQTNLGAWLSRAGSSLIGLQDIPTKPGYTFQKWGKTSLLPVSIIGNIQDNVTFVAAYTSGSIIVADPTVVMSSNAAINRATDVTATIGNIQAGYSYYYTLDGSKPTTSTGIPVTGSTITIPKQDTDLEKVITVNVIATKSGVYSNAATATVKFLAGTQSNDPTTVVDGITYAIHSNGTATLVSATGKTGAISIPYTVNGNKVTEIGQVAFKNCAGVTSVTIPNTVSTIGAYAFQNCTGLTSIDIPPSITVLNGGTFSGCSALSSVKLPNSISSMQPDEFTGCNSLDIIQANAYMLGKITLTGFNKVRFMEDDESTLLGGWYARNGVSMIGKQAIPVKANYTFNKWTKYNLSSNSILSDIEDGVTFEAVYNSTPGTSGPGQVSKAELTPSKEQAANRETGVTIEVK